MGDLDDRLEDWGRSDVPEPDGAFVNRLDASLREQMVGRRERSVFMWLFRPGILAVGALVLVAGLAFGLGRGEDRLGVANEETTTTAPQPAPTVTPSTAVTSAPTTSPAVGSTPDESDSPTTIPATTIPATTTSAGATTEVPTTTTDTTTPTTATSTTTSTVVPAIDPLPITELSAQRNGRELTVTWRVSTEGTDVAGWVLLSESNGTTEVVDLSRDPATRRFIATISSLDADYRIEGRAADSSVVFDSGEILFSPDE